MSTVCLCGHATCTAVSFDKDACHDCPACLRAHLAAAEAEVLAYREGTEDANYELREKLAAAEKERDEAKRAALFAQLDDSKRDELAAALQQVEALKADAALAREAMLREALEFGIFCGERQILAVSQMTALPYIGYGMERARAALSASPSDWLAAKYLKVGEAVRRAVRDVADSEREAIDEVDLVALLKGIK